MHTPADPEDIRSQSTRRIDGVAVEIQNETGTIHVYDRGGSPLLKITGLPAPVPTLGEVSRSDKPLLLHVISREVNGESGPYVASAATCFPSATAPGTAPQAISEHILRQAGATVIGFTAVTRRKRGSGWPKQSSS